jgi:hypothetical protein
MGTAGLLTGGGGAIRLRFLATLTELKLRASAQIRADAWPFVLRLQAYAVQLLRRAGGPLASCRSRARISSARVFSPNIVQSFTARE